MASSIDITPSLGHSVLCTQLGVGSTPGYDAIDMRRLSAIGVQEGVHSSAGWKVSEHSPNNMSVDVAASSGIATINGDAVTNQGKYVVAPHSSTANLTITAANATNPRIDQVILHAYDTSFDGLGFNKASLEVLTGTATAGATRDNRNGAAALPGSALRLADILVPAGSTSVVNGNLRDRRKWANGACWRGTRTSGAVTRAGTSANQIDTTNLQVRLECSGFMFLFTLIANSVFSTDSGWTGMFMDGNEMEGATKGLGYSNQPGGNAGFSYMFTPPTGSHLFAPTFQSAGGQQFVLQADNTRPIIFGVRELLMGLSADSGLS